jgi:hypothetical protein
LHFTEYHATIGGIYKSKVDVTRDASARPYLEDHRNG